MQLELGYNQIVAATIASTPVGLANGVLSVAAVAIKNPGTGYNPGDVVTVVGGTYRTMLGFPPTTGPAQFVVQRTIVPSGAVVSLVPINTNLNYNSQGFYSVFPATSGAATTTSGAGTGLTLNLTSQTGIAPAICNYMTIQAEAQYLRIAKDGAVPTSTFGEIINAGDTYPYYGNPANVQIICGATAGGIANVNFYRI